MIIDKKLEFANKQKVTAAAAGSYVADLVKGGDAVGEELTLHVICTATATGTGSPTLTVKLQTSEVEAFGTPTDLVLSGAIPLADLKAGRTVFKVRVPSGAKRYMRVYFAPSAALTGGAFSAFATSEL